MSENNSNESTNTTSKIDAIDKAIQNAAARKAAKDGNSTNATANDAESKRPRLSDEEKAARQAAKDAERAEKKAARDAARAEKKAAKEAEKANRTPHMSKVEKAAGRLPALDEATQDFFNEITANLSAANVSSLAAHLTHFNRVKATERALKQVVKNGDTVRIISGDARYLGMEGVVAKAQRIRCYVTIEGVNKDVYLFTSDVEVIDSVATAATGT